MTPPRRNPAGAQPHPPYTLPIRTRGGRLVGFADPSTGVLEVRDGGRCDYVDLRAALSGAQDGGRVVVQCPQEVR